MSRDSTGFSRSRRISWR